VTWPDRAFQVQATTIIKTRSPTADSRERWTGSNDVDADRRRDLIPRSVGWKSSLTRYTSVPFCGSIWKPEWRVCTESVLELSALVLVIYMKHTFSVNWTQYKDVEFQFYAITCTAFLDQHLSYL